MKERRILLMSLTPPVSTFLMRSLRNAGYYVAEASRNTVRRSLSEQDWDVVVLKAAMLETDMNCVKDIYRINPAQVVAFLVTPQEEEKYRTLLNQYASIILEMPLVMDVAISHLTQILDGRDVVASCCGQLETVVAYRDLTIDRIEEKVFRDECDLELTQREFELLTTLMMQDKPISRKHLLASIWHVTKESNLVDVYVASLRQKIDKKDEPSYITTVRGVGYALRKG